MNPHSKHKAMSKRSLHSGVQSNTLISSLCQMPTGWLWFCNTLPLGPWVRDDVRESLVWYTGWRTWPWENSSRQCLSARKECMNSFISNWPKVSHMTRAAFRKSGMAIGACLGQLENRHVGGDNSLHFHPCMIWSRLLPKLSPPTSLHSLSRFLS